MFVLPGYVLTNPNLNIAAVSLLTQPRLLAGCVGRQSFKKHNKRAILAAMQSRLICDGSFTTKSLFLDRPQNRSPKSQLTPTIMEPPTTEKPRIL